MEKKYLLHEAKAPSTLADSLCRRTPNSFDNRTQLVKNNSVEDVTVSYTYNTLHQLTEESWTEGGVAKVNYYDYDLAGHLTSKEEVSGGVRSASWGYDWDIYGNMEQITKMDSDGATILYTIEYKYCVSCDGARKERIKRDDAGDVVSWLRYEEQGNSCKRIDEKYDSDSDNDIDENDGWRRKQYTVQGPNGELVKEVMYTYSSVTSSTPSSTDQYYYSYDRIASVMNVYNSSGYTITDGVFEQDSFGNEMNNSWLDNLTRHFGGHIWEEDEGLYHSNISDPSTAGISAEGEDNGGCPPGTGIGILGNPGIGPKPCPGHTPTPLPTPLPEPEFHNYESFWDCMERNWPCEAAHPLSSTVKDCVIGALGGALIGLVIAPPLTVSVIIQGCGGTVGLHLMYVSYLIAKTASDCLLNPAELDEDGQPIIENSHPSSCHSCSSDRYLLSGS